MSAETKIEWTDATWNPTRGCTKISPGCKHCYAETFAERWRGVPGHAYEQGFDLRLVPDALDKPLHWKKPRRIFVNSMSDLFHKEVPFEFIEQAFAVMANCPQHTFQVLTKRAARMREFFEHVAPFGQNVRAQSFMARRPDVYRWPLPNVWLGVSVEDQECADERIPHLLATPAAVRFLSVEPMLGPVDLGKHLLRPCSMCNGSASVPAPGGGKPCPRCFDVGQFVDPDQIGWVIVGGESGAGARPFDLAWARSIVAQCRAAGVPVFYKQAGSQPVKTLDGEVYRIHYADKKGGNPVEWPEDLRVREFPR